MFIENFKKLIQYYGKGRKLKLVGFSVLSLFAGSLEFLGIAFIYPFIMLMINPEGVIHTKYYKAYEAFIHIDNVIINTFIIGVLVFLLFVLKNLFMIFCMYLQNKFTSNWKRDINKKIMYFYLFSSYKDGLKISPSHKIYNLTALTSQVIDGFALRGIILVTNIIIITIILTLLLIKFPIAALTATFFVFLSMIIQSKFFKTRTTEISKKLLKLSVLTNNKIMNCISNLKELKILSAEEYFYDEYVTKQNELTNISFLANFYNLIPPYIVEILVVLALLIMAAIISIQNFQNASGIIASYAIIAAAIFRIAPALNKIQISINTMNSSRDFVKQIIAEYEKSDFRSMDQKTDLKLGFSEHLRLENINFAYDEGKPIIKSLNLEITKGEFIGIIGASGAGKSTLADIIMGLLPIDSGNISIDGLQLNSNNFSALRKLIGYVPQTINILEASFKENVAWGVNSEDIDEEEVIRALKMAAFYDFVEGFEDGINANVIIGSNGLSQGQKQRLAIARALYRNPQILIFDEATSALDVETEYAITQMINQIKGEKTIVAIAHRLSTLKSCDRLIYLKEGTILDVGTFEELSEKHADFKRLVELSNLNKRN